MDRSQLFLLASLHQDNVREQNESTLVAGLLAQGYDLPTAHRLVREYMQANAPQGKNWVEEIMQLVWIGAALFVVVAIILGIFNGDFNNP